MRLSRSIFSGFLFSILTAFTCVTVAQEYTVVENMIEAQGLTETFLIGGASEDRVFAYMPKSDLLDRGSLDTVGRDCGVIQVLEKNASGLWRPSGVELRAEPCFVGDLLGFTNIQKQGEFLYAAMPGDYINPQPPRLDSSATGIFVWREDASYEGDSDGFNKGFEPVGLIRPEGRGPNESIGTVFVVQGEYMAVAGIELEENLPDVVGDDFEVWLHKRVFLFKQDSQDPAIWRQSQIIESDTFGFGISFAFDDAAKQLVVVAPFDRELFENVDDFDPPGSLEVYERDFDGQFQHRQSIVYPEFNNSIADPDILGNLMAASVAIYPDRGRVAIYTRDDSGEWTLASTINDPSPFFGGPSFNTENELLTTAGSNPGDETGYIAVYNRIPGSVDYQLNHRIEHPSAQSGKSFRAYFYGRRPGDEKQTEFFATGNHENAVDAYRGVYFLSNHISPYKFAAKSMSGLWYNPARSGEGFLIDVLAPDRAVVFWFTYGPDGGQAWMVGSGTVENGQILSEDVVITSGPTFGSAFDPHDLERLTWGSIRIDFNECDSGRVSYSGDEEFGNGSTTIVRLSSIEGISCDPDTKGNSSTSGFSGAFYNPARDGEGIQLQIVDSGSESIAVVYWFTYDAEGNQVWLFGSGPVDGDQMVFDSVLRPTGAEFGRGFDPSDISLESWGSAQLRFGSDCNVITFEYDSDNSSFGRGSVSLVRLYSLEGASNCPL